MDQWLSTQQMGLAVALGAGLLVGLERERRKGQGDDREAAGLRTFMVAALAGVMAQLLSTALAAIALGGVALLAGLSYWRSRSRDPGVTTELALLATALIGMLAAVQPALAAGCAVLLAVILAARERLHHFATEWLNEQELHDGLLLSALALVLLPLLPSQPLAWMGQLSPQRVLMLVITILLMQAAGHVGQRLLGARLGLALSGLFGGFVSSTATISAMGGMARSGQAPWRLALCASVMSMVATWLQMWLMASVVSADAARQISPMVGVGVLVPVLGGLFLWRGVVTTEAKFDAAMSPSSGALRVREALMVALLLVGGAVLVNLAQQLGTTGVMLGTAIAALADAHAPMASLMALFGAGKLDLPHLQWGLMAALSANGLTRTSAALTSGGQRFGLAVGLALALNLLTAGLWLAFGPAWQA